MLQETSRTRTSRTDREPTRERYGLPDLAASKTICEHVFRALVPLPAAGGLGEVADEQVPECHHEREEDEPPDAHEPPPSTVHVIVAIPHLREHDT
jgi:hypothetical protein